MGVSPEATLTGAVEPGFWEARRVLVTGHTGFKGAWLTLWLTSMGASVTGFSLDVPTEPSLFELARVGDGVLDLRGDIRDAESLAEAFRQARPEIVIHMAAQSLVRLSFQRPRETYETNVIGTLAVLEAARESPDVKVILNVTSDKCYENREWEWGYREVEPMGGHDPYSSSKGCAEILTAAFRRSFFSDPDGPRLASARAGNVIGGGDWARDRLVADLMRSALAGETLKVRNPDSVRPWQHVLNPLGGYLVLAQALWSSPELADGWNFGPSEDDARPVRWLVERLAESWPGGLQWEHGLDGPALHEARYLKLDSSKSRARLGWLPAVELEQALRSIVDWYASLQEGADMRAVTIGQIESLRDAERSRA